MSTGVCVLTLVLVFCGLSLVGTSATVSMQVNSDGTASANGGVVENHKGCVRDGACYFRLMDGNSEIRIVYHPGETAVPIINTTHLPELMKVKAGATITAYGSHRAVGSLHTIDVYSKKEYFVHIVSNER